jgi:guanylate kinase
VTNLTVISGPTAVGKGTVIAKLRSLRQDLTWSVSVTTRPPRPGEVHGEHYWFVSDEEFDRLIAQDRLLEWATVHGTHRYGTLRPHQNIKHLLVEIDLAGAEQIRKSEPSAVLIQIVPPGDAVEDQLACLRQRSVGRGTETPDQLLRRLETAAVELSEGLLVYDYFVENDDVDTAAKEICAIIDAA